MVDKSEKSETGEIKKSFTIRLEEDIIDRLEIAGKQMGLKAGTIARNYLSLSKCLLVQAGNESVSCKSYDNTPMMLIPIDIIKSLLPKDQKGEMDIGDVLGKIINANCEVMGITETVDKIQLAAYWGWFQPAELKIPNSAEVYIGIPKTFMSLIITISMIYRLHTRKAVNDNMFVTDAQIDAQFPKTGDKKGDQAAENNRNARRGARDAVRKEINQVVLDAEEGSAYYKFEVLKKKGPAPPTPPAPAATPK